MTEWHNGKNARGFPRYEMVDSHGKKLVLRHSSAVDPHMWIFPQMVQEGNAPPLCGAHLTPQMAMDVGQRLINWADQFMYEPTDNIAGRFNSMLKEPIYVVFGMLDHEWQIIHMFKDKAEAQNFMVGYAHATNDGYAVSEDRDSISVDGECIFTIDMWLAKEKG